MPVLRLAQERADEQLLRDELCRLAQVIAGVERGEIARQRVERLELAAQQVDAAQLLAQKELDDWELRRFLEGLDNCPAPQPYIEAQGNLAPADDLCRDHEPELEVLTGSVRAAWQRWRRGRRFLRSELHPAQRVRVRQRFLPRTAPAVLQALWEKCLTSTKRALPMLQR